MKKLIIFIFALGIALSPIVAFGDNSWLMFLPAIISGGDSNDLTCSGIAGCYSGTLSDSCAGYWVGGKIGIAVNTDCTFSSISQYGVESNGVLTSRQGNVFNGTAQTDANGCGQFSITCTDYGASISCDYQYTNGKTGSIRNAYLGQCRSANQYLTETLAGSWTFSYTLISTWNDYYDLDFDSVAEYPSGSDEFSIYGDDQYGNLVVAGYDPAYKEFSLYDPGSIIDQMFTFIYTNTNTVAGCYYQYSHSAGAWSSCYAMVGTRSTASRVASVTEPDFIDTEEQQRLLAEQGNYDLADKETINKLNALRDKFVTE